MFLSLLFFFIPDKNLVIQFTLFFLYLSLLNLHHYTILISLSINFPSYVFSFSQVDYDSPTMLVSLSALFQLTTLTKQVQLYQFVRIAQLLTDQVQLSLSCCTARLTISVQLCNIAFPLPYSWLTHQVQLWLLLNPILPLFELVLII